MILWREPGVEVPNGTPFEKHDILPFLEHGIPRERANQAGPVWEASLLSSDAKHTR